MGVTATLNVRIPESLKAHGSQVLERNSISTTQAVRGLFEYMEREQKVPACICAAPVEDRYEKRRAMLKSFAGCAAGLPDNWSMGDIHAERLSRLVDGRLS